MSDPARTHPPEKKEEDLSRVVSQCSDRPAGSTASGNEVK